MEQNSTSNGGRNSSELAISLKVLAIALAVMVFYYQDLSIVFSNALQNEATNYVLLIPFLAGEDHAG